MPEPVSTLGLLAGYAALQMLARAGSAVSPEAQAVRSAASAVVESTERSHALFGSKAAAISQIWALAAECAQPDWDGYGGQPIASVAAFRAVEFVRALPEDIWLPEFAPEPDGAISLDWITARNRLFSVSVGTNDRLAYIWIDGTDRGHAAARFDGEKIPARILQGIRSITTDGGTSFRAA